MRARSSSSSSRAVVAALAVAVVCCLSVARAVDVDVASSSSSSSSSSLWTSAAAYDAARAALVDTDRALDLASVLGVTLSADERRVDTLLDELRARDAAATSEPGDVPTHSFLRVHEWLDSGESVLMPFVRAMPKGSLLHAHLSAATSFDWLVSNATYEPHCYVYTAPTSRYTTHGSLHFYADGDVPNDAGWQSVATLRAAASNVSEFDASLLAPLELTARTQPEPRTYLDVWRLFIDCFRRVYGAANYVPVTRGWLEHIVRTYADAHVTHIEMRISPTSRLYHLNGTKVLAVPFAIDALREITAEYGAATGQLLTFRVIASGTRHASVDSVYEALSATASLRTHFPELVGFDLVGQEDFTNTLEHFLPAFLKFNTQQPDAAATMRYYFHAGESDLFNNTNLYDALLLNSSRVGHGYNMWHSPTLVEAFEKRRIGIEVCPISNQVLGLLADLRMHPAAGYVRRGLPVTISTDDPGIFGYGESTYDWYEAIVAWRLSLANVKATALESLIQSSLDRTTKLQQIDQFSRQWQAWIATMLEQHAPLLADIERRSRNDAADRQQRLARVV